MTSRLTIEWEPGRHPVSGALATGATPPHEFTGWLELLALLQVALSTDAGGSTPHITEEDA